MTQRDLQKLWQGFSRGDGAAREQLLGLYYDEFRGIARRILKNDIGMIHIQPTDLVHEAALRMIKSSGIAVSDQTHFLALAARMMRMTLIDEVRKHKSAKRKGDVMTLITDIADDGQMLDIETFDDTLKQLADVDEEAARIVELRFYAGLSMADVASVLGHSERTVHRRWQTARAWLLKELQ